MKMCIGKDKPFYKKPNKQIIMKNKNVRTQKILTYPLLYEGEKKLKFSSHRLIAIAFQFLFDCFLRPYVAEMLGGLHVKKY